MIEQTLDLLSHTIKKKTEQVQMDPKHDLPLIVDNTQQIEQIVVDLVLNALDALPPTVAELSV